jgi:hypothetical protein
MTPEAELVVYRDFFRAYQAHQEAKDAKAGGGPVRWQTVDREFDKLRIAFMRAADLEAAKEAKRNG